MAMDAAQLQPARIAVLRALQLGDLLCAVPALRALRARFPPAHITLIGLPWARTFRRRFARLLDDFIEFPGFPGLPEREPLLERIPRFLEQARRRQFDLAVQLHGSGQLSNPIALLLGAHCTVGFHPEGGWCPDPAAFWPYPERVHEVRRHLQLIGRLGADVRDERLEFPLREADWEECARLVNLDGLRRGSYVCLHPGARAANRRWHPQYFAAVGDALAKCGLQAVITGNAAEHRIAQSVARAMRAKAINAACDVSVGGLAALLAGARLVVCNDTGAAHLARALDVPSIAVHLASDPARWGPLDSRRHRAVHDACGVAPGAVLDEAHALLGNDR